MRKLQLVGVIVLGMLAQGCDTSGLHPLNSLIDRTTNCGRSSWLRTTETGTEVFLLGELDPTTPVDAQDICFVRAFVEHDSTAFVEQGTYTLDEDGVGQFSVDQIYTFNYQPDIGPLQREGAKVEDNPTPSSYELTIEADGSETLIALDGTARRLTNIYDVIAQLDPTTMSGAEDVFRMYNLTLFTSQVRILAFGGAGMTMYLNSRKSFEALVAGSFSVLVEFPLAKTTISYEDYEDLHGIYIDGDQITSVNASGDGGMSGALTYAMRGSEDASDVLVSGSLDYAHCVIDNGVAAGGHYVLNVDGHGSYEISYMLAADTDLRGVLPVSAP